MTQKLDELQDLIKQLTEEEADQVFRFMKVMVEKNQKMKDLPPELRLYTLKDLEKIFLVTRRTLQTWIADGSLPVSKIGGKWRMTQKDLDEFIQNKMIADREKRKVNDIDDLLNEK